MAMQKLFMQKLLKSQQKFVKYKAIYSMMYLYLKIFKMLFLTFTYAKPKNGPILPNPCSRMINYLTGTSEFSN